MAPSSERVVLTLLLSVIGLGFLWMGFWGLRGRDTFLPAAGYFDGNPLLDGDPPHRRKAARWAGLLYVIGGLVAIVVAIRQWL